MNVLLDLDGTLTDPKAGFVACIGHALERLGLPRAPEHELARYIGPPLEQSMATLLGPERAHELGAAVGLYRERYAVTGIFENEIYPGVADAVGELQSLGHRLFLATSKPEEFAVRILDHFGLRRFFSGVHGSRFDGTRADKGELIAWLLRQESIAPASAVMVGDRMHDVRGARANAVLPVGVLWGYGSRPELEGAGAALLVETPAQLAGALSHLRRG